MNMNAMLTVKRGYSDDGGFHYTLLRSEELTWDEVYNLGNGLESIGALQRISGYTILSERFLAQRGEEFTVQQVLDYIENGRRLIAEREAAREKTMVQCDCGHRVPRGQVMSTSSGTSCPDCYDSMSDSW